MSLLFGIFNSCPHINNSKHFHKDIQCDVSTPFVISQYRSACVTYQHIFAKTQCFQNIKPKNEQKSEHVPTDFVNNKASYANLLYYRWLDDKLKRITSRQLGISYNSNIHARDSLLITKLGNRHMYQKTLSNFQYTLNHNLRTQKQQNICFKCTCRRVFNKMRLPFNRKAKNQDYLAMVCKYHFLFLKSQYVKVLIRYLLYKQSHLILNADDYPFLVPYFVIDSNYKKQIMMKLNQASMLFSPSVPPVDYNPILDVFIPTKYHDIIPKDLIYVNDRYVVPESCEWFTYMYNVDESFYPSEDKTSRYNTRGKYITRTPIYRFDIMGIYVPSHIVEKSQQHRINRLKLEAEATYHGMTPKHYNAHVNNIASLTHASESFHSYIPNYLVNRDNRHQQGLS
ncbi:hypothetical protein RhiirA1_461676 [Rhizophagus irregularis]|uniref:DUF8211 domain-containing protein n=1 Tax=Rhizophagus irregularis TaxID=588596 RepID=A0A2I1ET75_9GLOM|nr:hypothetical protein RhiirA1_461676 [Rhizophagus irregularis]PKY25285.1 hypothetical protein RhiirB3_440169 [Rhizophagus irregularis]CAB5216221.1 unnamed protein product [Rhizophagus irregularis]